MNRFGLLLNERRTVDIAAVKEAFGRSKVYGEEKRLTTDIKVVTEIVERKRAELSNHQAKKEKRLLTKCIVA